MWFQLTLSWYTKQLGLLIISHSVGTDRGELWMRKVLQYLFSNIYSLKSVKASMLLALEVLLKAGWIYCAARGVRSFRRNLRQVLGRENDYISKTLKDYVFELIGRDCWMSDATLGLLWIKLMKPFWIRWRFFSYLFEEIIGFRIIPAPGHFHLTIHIKATSHVTFEPFSMFQYLNYSLSSNFMDVTYNSTVYGPKLCFPAKEISFLILLWFPIPGQIFTRILPPLSAKSCHCDHEDVSHVLRS